MTKIICIANQKGGTGKTTCAVGIAGELAKSGAKVLVADFDPQHSATDWLSRIEDCPVGLLTETNQDRLDELKAGDGGWEYVLVDTPGSLETAETLASIAKLSDFVVIPTELGRLSVNPMIRTIRELIVPTSTPYKALFNKVRAQAGPAAQEAQASLTQAGVPVFTAVGRLLVAHEKASNLPALVTDMPGGERASHDMARITLELITSLGGLNR